MRFLENLDGFYGTGERDSEGRTLEEFLESYDPKKYDSPFNTTDIVVVRCKETLTHWGQPLQVLMVKRKNHPSIGYWATPGGFVEFREDLETGAARELMEETGVEGLPLRQMRTWGAYDRDPRWRVITTSYLALVEGDIPVQAGDDAADALWMDVSLTKEAEEEEKGEKTELWHLELTNKEQQLVLSAKVKRSISGHPLLAKESYELVSSDKIAVDHGCILTQALLYLMNQREMAV